MHERHVSPAACSAVLKASVCIIHVLYLINFFIYSEIVQIIKGRLDIDVQLENHSYNCNIVPSAASGCCPRSPKTIANDTDAQYSRIEKKTSASAEIKRNSSPPREETRHASMISNKETTALLQDLQEQSRSLSEKKVINKGGLCNSQVSSEEENIYEKVKDVCCKRNNPCIHGNVVDGLFVFKTPTPCQRKFL